MSHGMQDYATALDWVASQQEIFVGKFPHNEVHVHALNRTPSQDKPGATDLTIASARTALAEGSIYWVADEIWDVVRAAAETLPSDGVRFMHDLLPSESGLMYFATPHNLWWDDYDPDGSDHDWRALAWSPDLCIPCLEKAKETFEWHDLGGSYAFEGKPPLGDCCGVAITCFSEPFSDSLHRHTYPYTFPVKFNEPVRKQFYGWLLSAFLFMRQEILDGTQMYPERAARRRYERRYAREAPPINVVHLRRRLHSSSASDRTAEQEWSCQWLVRGHWRQQWYASAGQHRPKWILPYMKGPDDKPFRAQRPTVYAVVR